MSDQSSEANTPRRKHRTIPIRFFGDVVREYPMYELTEHELKNARQTVAFARDRIKKNGGDSGPSAIDRHGANGRCEWAKALLKPRAGWSCKDALDLSRALQQCEIDRVTMALCEANSRISKPELRRRYTDWRDKLIAETERKTGEVVGGVDIEQGGPIASEYDDWIASQADYETMTSLQGLQQGLMFRQLITNAAKSPGKEPYSCAMLYESNAVASIASEIARYLADQGVIYGAGMKPYDRAYDALLKLFGGGDANGIASFRDRCEWEFWTHFRRFDAREVERIRLRICVLQKDDGTNDGLRETVTMENGARVSRFDGDSRTAFKSFMPPRGALAAPVVEHRIKSKNGTK